MLQISIYADVTFLNVQLLAIVLHLFIDVQVFSDETYTKDC